MALAIVMLLAYVLSLYWALPFFIQEYKESKQIHGRKGA